MELHASDWHTALRVSEITEAWSHDFGLIGVSPDILDPLSMGISSPVSVCQLQGHLRAARVEDRESLEYTTGRSSCAKLTMVAILVHSPPRDQPATLCTRPGEPREHAAREIQLLAEH